MRTLTSTQPSPPSSPSSPAASYSCRRRRATTLRGCLVARPALSPSSCGGCACACRLGRVFSRALDFALGLDLSGALTLALALDLVLALLSLGCAVPRLGGTRVLPFLGLPFAAAATEPLGERRMTTEECHTGFFVGRPDRRGWCALAVAAAARARRVALARLDLASFDLASHPAHTCTSSSRPARSHPHTCPRSRTRSGVINTGACPVEDVGEDGRETELLVLRLPRWRRRGEGVDSRRVPGCAWCEAGAEWVVPGCGVGLEVGGEEAGGEEATFRRGGVFDTATVMPGATFKVVVVVVVVMVVAWRTPLDAASAAAFSVTP